MQLTAPSSTQLRVGYVPLVDSAPLIAAVELGICARHGLKVKLMRQLGWANVRDHVIFGELDATASVPPDYCSRSTPDVPRCLRSVSTGFIFNLQGNAITLSKRLYDEGIRDLTDTGGIRSIAATARCSLSVW